MQLSKRVNDLTGKRFGRLTVIKPIKKAKNGNIIWLCSCDCGNKKPIISGSLVNGLTKSCGCLIKEVNSKLYKKPIVPGTRFGRLIVIKECDKIKDNIAYLCKCDCGNEKVIRRDSLVGGKTKSCGCLSKEKTKRRSEKLLSPGTRFGRLLIIKRINNVDKAPTYLCSCDCGNEVEMYRYNLVAGRTKSCGCLSREKSSERRGPKSPSWNLNREHVIRNRKLKVFMHRVVYNMLTRKSDHSETILGYTKKDLWEHLEAKFNEKMNWFNHGSYWHVDHILPISFFVKNGIEDPKVISALDNLQPMEKIANLKKGDTTNKQQATKILQKLIPDKKEFDKLCQAL